jgi:hypothetical protein
VPIITGSKGIPIVIMIVAVHQPQYLPWLGYFDKIDRADVFVLLDNVQYKKNEWQNRNRIRTAQGWQWISVPVLNQFTQQIKDVRINSRVRWKKKHFHALLYNYAKSHYFKEHRPFFERTYNRDWQYLLDINTHVVKYLVSALGINTEIVIASNLNVRNHPTERLIDICKALGADTYLAGIGGYKYMDMERFKQAGIEVIFQDFKHRTYSQLFGTFEPFMSVVDLLFNHGKESLNIIREMR